MTVSNTTGNAFVALVVIVVLLGLGMGLLLNNTDLANFMRNGAEAEQQHIANQYQAAQNEVDLQYYRVERQHQAVEALRQINAESNAKIAQAQEELRVQQENNTLRLERDAQVADAAIKLLIGLGFGLSAALSLGITFVFYRMAQGLPFAAFSERPKAKRVPAPSAIDLEPWHDPIHRAWRIAQARSRELKDLEHRMVPPHRNGRARVVTRH